MKLSVLAATLVAGSIAAAPAIALPSQAPANPGMAFIPAGTPAASSQEAGAPSETPTAESNPGTSRRPEGAGSQSAKAPGRYCANQSRKPVKGEKGSAFSRCVKAMRKAGNGTNPTTACKGLSKRRGEAGKSAFAKCVSAAAQLQRDQEQADEDESTEDGSETAPAPEAPASQPEAS